jgi:cobalt/nickel transport system permease protein
MGIAFLKAHDFSAEMYEAMECRGFTGEYEVPRHSVLSAAGITYCVLIAFEILFFLYLEGIIL